MSFATEISKATWNKIRTFGNPEFFREQSLVLASLSLVILRVIQANVSAIQARGTEEGPYRYREAIRTDIRELGGFTMGFLVLRQLQSAIKSGLAKAFNMEVSKNEYSLRENFKKIWNGGLADKFEPNLAYTSEIGFKNNKVGNWVKDLLAKPSLQNLVGKVSDDEAKKALTQIYKIAPIAIGSVPAVLLAGYALEKLTRDHSEKIVDGVSKMFHPAPKKAAGAPPLPTKHPLPKRPNEAKPIANHPTRLSLTTNASVPAFAGQTQATGQLQALAPAQPYAPILMPTATPLSFRPGLSYPSY